MPTHRVCVTTNIGWTTRGGRNPMGRGIALQAAQRFPDLPALYGVVCRSDREHTNVVEYKIGRTGALSGPLNAASALFPSQGLIMFPTKPFNPDAPHLSWHGKASLDLIERGVHQLAGGWSNVPVALPLVGCANGGLRDTDVLPILERHLKADNFLLVLR